ncbi:hypothetical protein RhiirB3_430325 [Rhizophagus irregularis]|nr:hypothetical protein RhiirB3_430325 [Rhizophagus irregularis]
MVCNSRTDGRNTHEETAKWMLEYLFKENLLSLWTYLLAIQNGINEDKYSQ